MDIKASKVLRTAAEHLEAGWCQGALGLIYDEETGQPLHLSSADFQPGMHMDRVCVEGALMRAAVNLTGEPFSPGTQAAPTYARASSEVMEVLRDVTGQLSSIPMWNDAQDRTQDEVVKLVQYAARRAEEAGR